MKKMKKFLAGVLALAMAMSMMTMTAFASEVTRPTGPTIPDSGEGSLTIHKLKKDDSITDWPASTGDVLELPGGSQPLEGVDFEIYLVETDLSKFYNTEPDDDLFKPATYYTKGEDGTLTVMDGSSNTIEDPTAKGTTNADGIVKFEGLDLGLYLVIEPAKAGSVVSAPVAPFLVSIPMTNSAGTGWLYDVHVYPKNATDQMDDAIVLIKYGKDAGVDKKTPLTDVTFILQRQDETTNKWVDITHEVSASGALNGGAELNLTTSAEAGKEGTISVSGLSVGKYRFIETDLGSNNGYILDGATTYKFEIARDDATKELYVIYGSDDAEGLGYVITDDAGEWFTKKFDTRTDTGTPRIAVINEKPVFDKEIADEDGNTTDSSKHSVGDIIDYQLEVDVPSKIAKMKTFQIVDNPTNLKDMNVKVYLDDGETEVGLQYYSVTYTDAAEDGTQGFLLVFNTKANGADTAIAGRKLIVKYQAELLEGALENVANSNDAQLIYSTNTDKDEMDDDNPNKKKEEEVEAQEKTAYAYSYKIKVAKYADAKSDKTTDRGLNGVKFDLYKEVSDLTAAELEGRDILEDDGTSLGLPSGKWEKIDELETDTVDGVKGIIIKGGLGNGTYYLVETKTAPTYNLLKEPVDVSLSLESETKYTEGWEKKTITVYEEQEDGTWKAVEKEVSVYTKTTTEKTTYDEKTDEGVYTKEIINRKGFTLPSTGGMGTFLFTFVGVAMMAAAVILFFTSKKKEAK